MKKCCMCGDVFEVGFEMHDGDCVCALYSCCYEYCRSEGDKIYQAPTNTGEDTTAGAIRSMEEGK